MKDATITEWINTAENLVRDEFAWSYAKPNSTDNDVDIGVTTPDPVIKKQVSSC